MTFYVLKWKDTRGFSAKVGEYLANTTTDSTKSLGSPNLAIFFTIKDITHNPGNIFDALNLSKYDRNPSWKQRFEIIKMKAKEIFG